jgi:FkbM family methyltransferase
LEVGGNIGYFTVLGAAAAKTASYHVVEPHPFVIKSLIANVARNKLDNVRVTQAAVVGDRALGHVRLSVPNEETGRLSTGAYIDGAENDKPSSEGFLVPTVRGAEIAARVDLLKIDAEGAEAEILTAMDPVLAQSLPIIMLEVLPETPQLRLWIKRFSESHNYQLWALCRHPKQVPLQGIETIDLNESYGTWDMLMVPAARLDRVSDIVRQ